MEEKTFAGEVGLKLLRFVNSIMVMAVNGIIYLAIEQTSLYEKHKTATSAQASFATKFTVVISKYLLIVIISKKIIGTIFEHHCECCFVWLIIRWRRYMER